MEPASRLPDPQNPLTRIPFQREPSSYEQAQNATSSALKAVVSTALYPLKWVFSRATASFISQPDEYLYKTFVDLEDLLISLQSDSLSKDLLNAKIDITLTSIYSLLSIIEDEVVLDKHPQVFTFFYYKIDHKSIDTLIQQLQYIRKNGFQKDKHSIVIVNLNNIVTLLQNYIEPYYGYLSEYSMEHAKRTAVVFSKCLPPQIENQIAPRIMAPPITPPPISPPQSHQEDLDNDSWASFISLFTKFAGNNQFGNLINSASIVLYPFIAPSRRLISESTERSSLALLNKIDIEAPTEALKLIENVRTTLGFISDSLPPTAARLEIIANRFKKSKPKDPARQTHQILRQRTEESLRNFSHVASYYAIYLACKAILGIGNSIHEKLVTASQRSLDEDDFRRICTVEGLEEMLKFSFNNIYERVKSAADPADAFIQAMNHLIDQNTAATFFQKILAKMLVRYGTIFSKEHLQSFFSNILNSSRSKIDQMRAHPIYKLDPSIFLHLFKAFKALDNMIKDYASGTFTCTFDEFIKKAMDDHPKYCEGMSQNEFFTNFTSAVVDAFIPNVTWFDTVAKWDAQIGQWADDTSDKRVFIFRRIITTPIRTALSLVNTFLIYRLQKVVNFCKAYLIKKALLYYKIPQNIIKSSLSTFFGEKKYSTTTLALKSILNNFLSNVVHTLVNQEEQKPKKEKMVQSDELKKAIMDFLKELMKSLRTLNETSQDELRRVLESRKRQGITDLIENKIFPVAADNLMEIIITMYKSVLERETFEPMIDQGIRSLSEALIKSDFIELDSQFSDKQEKTILEVEKNLKDTIREFLEVSIHLATGNIILAAGETPLTDIQRFIKDVQSILLGEQTDELTTDGVKQSSPFLMGKKAFEEKQPHEIHAFFHSFTVRLEEIRKRKNNLQESFSSDISITIIFDQIEMLAMAVTQLYLNIYISQKKDELSKYLQSIANKKNAFEQQFQNLIRTIERGENPLMPLKLCQKYLNELSDLSSRFSSDEYLPKELEEINLKIKDQILDMKMQIEHIQDYIHVYVLECVLETPYRALQPEVQQALKNTSENYQNSHLSLLGYLRVTKRNEVTEESSFWASMKNSRNNIALKDLLFIFTRFIPPESLSHFYIQRKLFWRNTAVGLLPSVMEAKNTDEVQKCIQKIRAKHASIKDKHSRQFTGAKDAIASLLSSEVENSLASNLLHLQQMIQAAEEEKEGEDILETSFTSFSRVVSHLLESLRVQIPDKSELAKELLRHPKVKTINSSAYSFLKDLLERLLKILPLVAPLLVRHLMLEFVEEK